MNFFPRRPLWVGLVALLLAAQPLLAQPAAPAADDPAGVELAKKMTDAYANTKQYAATTRFSINQSQGRWTNTRSADYTAAFDRGNDRLSLDQPEMLLVIKDGKLLFKAEQVPAAHVETDAAKPIDFAAVTGLIPFIQQLPLPDVVLLTAKDPVAQLSGGAGKPKAVGPEANDPAKRPGLQFNTEAGVMTLRLDPRTHLVSSAELVVDTAQFGGGGSMSITFDTQITSLDQPLADDRFAFDTTNSKAVASLDALAAAAQTAAGGGGAGPAQAANPLEGKPMPEVTLNDVEGKEVKLADEKAKVIILDFWATWCGPCRQGLPKLESVHQWARQNNKPVAIYAVNIAETPEQVIKFWADQKLTMPVLMDSDSKVADAYGVQGIPMTVLIHEGKVHHVHVGFDAGMDESLKKEIDALLSGEPHEH